MRIEDALQMRQERIAGGQETHFAAGINDNKRAQASKETSEVSAFYGGQLNVRPGNPGYNRSSIREESLVEEIASKGANFSGTETAKKQMSMAVAGFSVEDLSGAREAGFDVDDMEPDEVASVLDKIKMHLAMGGQDISMMGGLSSDDIAAVSGGNAGIENVIKDALQSSDLPATDDIVADAVTAFAKAQEIDGISEAASEYLLKNDLEPTIENIYMGEFSRGADPSPKPAVDEEAIKEMLPQIDDMLSRAGLESQDKGRENAIWMLQNDIPVTQEHLSYLNDLQNADADPSDEKIIQKIITSVDEGRRPQEAFVPDGYSLADRASAADLVIQNADDRHAARLADEGLELNISNLRLAADTSRSEAASSGRQEDYSPEAVKAQRILEETRLVMTAKANLSLMKRGIDIDTTGLSELVDQLKKLENSFYENALSNEDETISEAELNTRIELYENTNRRVEEISDMPEQLLGAVEPEPAKTPELAEAQTLPQTSGFSRIAHTTLDGLYRTGSTMREAFRRANETYETVGTQVRRDLGDSMKKAFGNIDEILEDLEMENTDANRRAVRILAYNRTEITTSSVVEMRAGSELVARTLKSLTPGVVAKMIRDGENPLKLSMEELHDRTIAIKEASASASSEERFSEFLYKAERSGDITQDERDAFVGVYRLIYQVKKTDGAVIGQLLNQGADITLENMMMAVRTRRAKNREFIIDDDFGGVDVRRSTLTITQQIEKAFMTDRMRDAGEAATPSKLAQIGEENYSKMSPDAFATALEALDAGETDAALQEEYEKEQLQRLQDAARSQEQIYRILEDYDLPGTASNLEVFSQMMADRNGMYSSLFGRAGRIFGGNNDNAANGDISDAIDMVLNDVIEGMASPEELAEVQRELEETAENVMRSMITERTISSREINGMRISLSQIRTLGEMGRRRETYSLPIAIGDGIGNMTLKIVRGRDEERGLVDIALDMEATGAIRASFSYENEGIKGMVTAERHASAAALGAVADSISQSMSEATKSRVSISVTTQRLLSANDIYFGGTPDFEVAGTNERPKVQTKVLYGIAQSFVSEISKANLG